MPPRVHEVAPQFTVANVTSGPIGEGTGLGLSVSLGIAEAHGGSLALMPTARGACFRLTIPAASSTPVDVSVLSAQV